MSLNQDVVGGQIMLATLPGRGAMVDNLANANTIIKQLALNATLTRFGLGFRDKQITLYRQQIRALNLAFALDEKYRSEKPLNVAVVGAGASGVTVSAALLLLGHRVAMFERQPEEMYLQRGCETRYLHPTSYDWPDLGSDVPYADLPMLAWRSSTAASVSRQILLGFKNITSLPAISSNYRFFPQSMLRASGETHLDWQTLSDRLPDGSRGHPGSETFSKLIICTGFGIETGVDDERHFSYWRNDSLNQIRTNAYAGSRAEYWISGTGDGALIDVQRLTIQDYDQSRFVYDVWHSYDDAKTVKSRSLREFKDAVFQRLQQIPGPTPLYDALSELENSPVVALLDNFLGEHRRDAFVILNGESQSFGEEIQFGRQSFLNALVCHRLYKQGAIVYLGGRLERDAAGAWHHPHLKHHRACQIIVRHGADPYANLRECGIEYAAEPEPAGPVCPLASHRRWPVGWWQNNVLDNAEIHKIVGNLGDHIESVSPDIQAVCEGFVSALAGLISHLQVGEGAAPEFRVCLHRLIQVLEKPYYQQITAYFGTRKGGPVGRVFDLNSGLAGLACRIQQTVIFGLDDLPKVEADRAAYTARAEELWQDLAVPVGGMRNKPEYALTYMAVPIYVKLVSSEVNPPVPVPESRVGFVLYLDSSTRLFQKEGAQSGALVPIIRAAFRQFCDSLQSMAGEHRAFFNDIVIPAGYPSTVKDDALFTKFKDLIRKDSLTLELPVGVTTEMTFNRFVDREF